VRAGSDPNRQVFDDVASHYLRSRELAPAERSILMRFRYRWDRTAVLDLGIGAGRTTYVLSAVARVYVGLDYAPAMVELASRLVDEDANTRVAWGDARDLSEFYGRNFDLVLFSFNGLDYVSLDDRVRVLHEIRQVLAPDGYFAFSSHSLAALPFRVTLDELHRGDGLVAGLRQSRAMLNAARARHANRALDLEAARARGWAMVRDELHGFRLKTYYGTAVGQVKQLEDAGFADVEVLDRSAARVDPARPGSDAWLYYVCRRS
jgi:SAM-dependent methyltransferase